MGEGRDARRWGTEVKADCAGMTHIGRRRNTNEDQFLVAELRRTLAVRQASLTDPARVSPPPRAQGQLLVVADGMGGHAGGGLASSLAVETVARFVVETLPWFTKEPDELEVTEALTDALLSCQTQLEATAREQGSPSQMGTTLTLAYVSWPRLYIAHAGDSRCYLHRQGFLEQLTRDHTVAQRMIEEESISPEQARSSPWNDILWNAVGGGSPELSPEVHAVELLRGDALLLCTDGLTKHVSDRTIAALLSDPTNASPTCERLIEAANAGGGTDNVTVIVARY